MTRPGRERPVRLEERPDEGWVAVLVDGDPFTAYRYGDPKLRKPVLFPVHSPSGAPVTRGHPLEPRREDRRDHPHQVGAWFAYGDVDGVDFWNSSADAPPGREDELGTVRHREVTAVDDDGVGVGAELEVRCDWCGPDGSVLEETTSLRVARARAAEPSIGKRPSLPTGEP